MSLLRARQSDETDQEDPTGPDKRSHNGTASVRKCVLVERLASHTTDSRYTAQNFPKGSQETPRRPTRWKFFNVSVVGIGQHEKPTRAHFFICVRLEQIATYKLKISYTVYAKSRTLAGKGYDSTSERSLQAGVHMPLWTLQW